MNIDCKISAAEPGEIDSILKIEKESFKSSWSIEGLLSELSSPNSHFIVAELDGEIVGYALSWLVVGDEIHLLKLAVSSGFRKRGIARALVAHIINNFKAASVILLEVREKSIEARSFYKKLGFIENGMRKNYYPDDNAILIEKKLR
ncbi:MAG: ribosomal protein S18-alanine N-acetyltransferase [Spirochaetota bacterium]